MGSIPSSATSTIALARFSAGKMGRAGLVTLALAGAVAVASPAAADPTGIALVESLTGNPSGVEFMDYVRAGQVIRLGPHQTIVLSYMASCVRETITGGTVTVGTQRSEVQSGHVRRIEGHCYSGRMLLVELPPGSGAALVEFLAPEPHRGTGGERHAGGCGPVRPAVAAGRKRGARPPATVRAGAVAAAGPSGGRDGPVGRAAGFGFGAGLAGRLPRRGRAVVGRAAGRLRSSGAGSNSACSGSG